MSEDNVSKGRFPEETQPHPDSGSESGKLADVIPIGATRANETSRKEPEALDENNIAMAMAFLSKEEELVKEAPGIADVLGRAKSGILKQAGITQDEMSEAIRRLEEAHQQKQDPQTGTNYYNKEV